MKPIILKEDGNGKIVVTADEVQKMVDDAYNSGYADGRNSCPTIINQRDYYPYYPINVTPAITWQSDKVMC